MTGKRKVREGPDGTLLCTQCGHFLPRDAFESDPKLRCGLRSNCRSCHNSKKLAAYYRRQSDVLARKRQEYRDDLEMSRLAGREKYKKYNSVELRERRNASRRLNPLANRVTNHRRRARLLKAKGSHTHEDIVAMYGSQHGLCFYCQTYLNGVFEIDHLIPLSRGGGNGKENIGLSCPRCNARKFQKTPEEMFWQMEAEAWLEKVSLHQPSQWKSWRLALFGKTRTTLASTRNATCNP